MRKKIDWLRFHLFEFSRFFFLYSRQKILTLSLFFEKNKNILVRFFMMRRGRYNRPFLHIIAMLVLLIAVLLAPFLADTYPIFSDSNKENLSLLSSAFEKESINMEDNVFKTEISQKPRDKVISYTVQKGETLSTIADKFGISLETIRWANDLANDYINVGDELKILPVTGISHKVSKGESVYTIAQRYSANPQAIVDFPFNDFANPETFSLVEGQMLIVPDGVKPTEKPTYKKPTYLVQGPASFSTSGFVWPVGGLISQFSSWYHTALDIAAPYGTAIVAAKSGVVIKALAGTWDGGYGNNIEIDHGDGFITLYSHLSAFNVSVGDNVIGGKTVIGAIGMTGRTTGPHVHFEIRKNGSLLNPLPFLQ